ncbi:MAG: carboxypeptidase-like regulatory domain-containing protein [Verrucomicrobiota bacterium]
MNTKRALQEILTLIIVFSFLSSAKADQTPASDAATGIEGVITFSPTHGGPIRQDEPGSKALPNMEFVVQNEKGTVASFTTDAQGQFHIALPAGHYSVSRKGGRHPIEKYGPFDVDVVAGKMTKVSWDCDSGMR